MHISKIELRDWKAYSAATFEFPAPVENKNIILIGALNGYGKTSLLEAIILGMFGRSGIPLIARSPFTGLDKERIAVSYKDFLERALHQGAQSEGRTSCSVKISFVTDDSEPLEIQRVWHFNRSGDYLPQDEQIHIFEGVARKAVGPGDLEENERIDWFREYIAEKLLPFTLAHFFIFDGEQVSVLSEREMSSQVRSGIEGLLGIPVLKQLALDLRTYAEARRREVPSIGVAEKKMESLESERQQLTFDCDEKTARLAVIEPKRANLKNEQENLIRDLTAFGSSSQAQFQEKFEKIKSYERSIETEKSQIENLMVQDLAFALSGSELRKEIKKQLRGENIRENWESGKNQSEKNWNKFTKSLLSELKKSKLAPSAQNQKVILESAKNAWEKVWESEPKNCADEFLHPYLSEIDRLKVINRLEEVEQLTSTQITKILESISKNEEMLEKLQSEVMRVESISPDVDKKRQRVSEISDQIQEYDQEIGSLKREITSLQSQINSKNAEHARISIKTDQATPSSRRAARANKVALMIDKIVDEAVPTQIEDIANAMTLAHRSMAQKKNLIEKISIDESCNVQLLNSDGIDLRDYDLSAGEKQIFTQALISAISSVSGCGFPMVVDAPLGRLDTEHRKGVLNHLVSRNNQVIILSTNTEVVGEYLEEIEPHIQAKYLVDFARSGDIGESSVRQGYFEEVAV